MYIRFKMCTNCSLTTKSTLVWKFELLASRFDAILWMGSAGSSLPFYWEDRINTDILDVLCRIRFFFIRTSVKNRLLSKQMHCHRHCRAGFRLPIFYGKRHFLNSDCSNDLYRTCSKFMAFMRDLYCVRPKWARCHPLNGFRRLSAGSSLYFCR